MYTKKGRVLIYGNVLVLVYIAHSFWCSPLPVAVTTRIFLIFSKGSLLSFTFHCYWEGEGPKIHKYGFDREFLKLALLVHLKNMACWKVPFVGGISCWTWQVSIAMQLHNIRGLRFWTISYIKKWWSFDQVTAPDKRSRLWKILAPLDLRNKASHVHSPKTNV